MSNTAPRRRRDTSGQDDLAKTRVTGSETCRPMSAKGQQIDHAAQPVYGSSRGRNRVVSGVRLDDQRQRRLADGQCRRQEGRNRDVALANGNETARRIGVVLDMQHIGERQQPRQISR